MDGLPGKGGHYMDKYSGSTDTACNHIEDYETGGGCDNCRSLSYADRVQLCQWESEQDPKDSEKFNRAMRARAAEPDRKLRAVPTPPLPAFPDTDLYANLIDLMGGDSASLDYLLGLLWASDAEREMRAIVLLGGRRSLLQLLRTIRQGFDASEVVSLPYNLIQPGAPHTRRTEPFAQVENKRLILFDPGESDPKLHAGAICQLAERDYVSCVTKGGATSIRVNAATIITIAGMPDCEDNRMAERCAVFELCGAAAYQPVEEVCLLSPAVQAAWR